MSELNEKTQTEIKTQLLEQKKQKYLELQKKESGKVWFFIAAAGYVCNLLFFVLVSIILAYVGKTKALMDEDELLTSHFGYQISLFWNTLISLVVVLIIGIIPVIGTFTAAVLIFLIGFAFLFRNCTGLINLLLKKKVHYEILIGFKIFGLKIGI